MKSTLWRFLIIFISIICFSQCAKTGTPNGGPKDTIPPIILKSNPENYNTLFSEDEIRIYFDENIKLKDLQQNLIVSPPLKYQPIITPLTSSKVLKIKILDTLKENTTYVFNFGRSIIDNNEGNEFEYFKYVFSTGDYIDSLKIKGTVKDATLPNPEGKTTMMLYEVAETINDSIIFSEKPTYIASTKEGESTFELTNLKEGNYLFIALQEDISNYTFQPKKDKIAFLENYITIPSDSSYELTLFKEVPDYIMTRPSHISKNKIDFGFEGNIDSLTITPITQLPEDFTSQIIRDSKKDTLHYWFKPAVSIEEVDTLRFLASRKGKLDTLIVKMRDLFADSLEVQKLSGNIITPKDSIKIGANTPLININSKNIEIIDKDSVAIEANVNLNKVKNEAAIIFPIKDDNRYNISILPNTFEDFFGETNDTLKIVARSNPLSDYGTLTFSLQNIEQFPIIVELVDEKFKVVATEYLRENKEVYFNYLTPNKYFLRITYDENENGRWDTGNFLRKIQPEKMVYYPKQIEIRSNWDVNEIFIVE